MTTDNQDVLNKAIAAMEERRDLYLSKAHSIEEAIEVMKGVFSTEFLSEASLVKTEAMQTQAEPEEVPEIDDRAASVPTSKKNESTTDVPPQSLTPASEGKTTPPDLDIISADKSDLEGSPFAKYLIKPDKSANAIATQDDRIVNADGSPLNLAPKSANKTQTYIQENIVKRLAEKEKSMTSAEITKAIYSNKVRSLWNREKKKEVDQAIESVLEAGIGTYWTKLGTKYSLIS